MTTADGVRPCSKCGIPKPPEEFHRANKGKNRRRRDQRTSRCKGCQREEYQRQVQEERERLLALGCAVSTDYPGAKTAMQSSYWSPEERFWRQTRQIENGCILWTGSQVPARGGAFYGQFRLCGRLVYVHRYAWGVAFGRLDPQLEVHHTCENTLCVNPEHLEALSKDAHGKHGHWARKMHCPSGHPYDEANTRLYQGRRYCRACHALRKKIRAAA